MAIYETPGTNFHDLNLDWLISKMKELITEWAATEQDWAGVQTIINGWPATFDAYYRQPGHQLPETITNEAQRVANAAVEEEAGLREGEDDRLSGEIETQEHRIDNALPRIAALETGLTEETTERTNADTTMAGNISTLTTNLNQEIERATTADAGLDSRLDAAEEAILGLEGAVRLDPADSPDVASGAYAILGGGGAQRVGETLNISEPGSGNFRAKIFNAAPFEVFCVRGNTASGNVPLCIFLDTNNVILGIGPSTTGAATARFGIMYYAPQNTAKVIFQENKTASTKAATYFYRGMLSPYSRIMFGGPDTVPNVTTGGRVFKYVREDTQSAQGLTYPLETFQWVAP